MQFLLFLKVLADQVRLKQNRIQAEKESDKQELQRIKQNDLLYENDKNLPFDKSNPNLVFQWEFNDSNPNLIKGIHGWKEKDTIMCWTYDQNKEIMIDEKGLVYKRKKI